MSVVSQLQRDLLDVLRDATGRPDLGFDGELRPLSGGFWAELLVLRLLDAPAGWEGELVVRLMPDPGIAAKESAVQAEVAAQGFPTPSVHLVGGPADGLGRSFMVMDLAAGGPLLSGLDGFSALTRAPGLVRRLPRTLADAMAALHRLDVAPVRARLEGEGDGDTGPAVELDDHLSRLSTAAAALDRHDLVDAIRWLEAHPPPAEPVVICHGDLHPFNLLVDAEADGAVTVLDWSAALLAPAAYDVAFTSLLLSEPPLDVPRPLAPVARGFGRLLARRFRRAYASAAARDLDPVSLRWHEAVVCLRALVEVAEWVAAGELGAHRGHPWLTSGPAFADRLQRLTGAPVRAR